MGLISKAVSRLYRPILLDQHEKFRRRMLSHPRYTLAKIPFLDGELEVVDTMSFWHAYQEIFLKHRYKFKTSSAQPIVIDGGANIGLASIYLNRLYPKGKIFAFEPDPVIFKTLERNIQRYCNGNVELIEKAIWSEEVTLSFNQEKADGGSVSLTENDESVHIQATSLFQYLQKPVSFLKLDIEGAEYEVLKSHADHLKDVENIFVEYHSLKESPQKLGEIIEILINAEFRLFAISDQEIVSPLIKRFPGKIDMQLNIFGYRSEAL